MGLIAFVGWYNYCCWEMDSKICKGLYNTLQGAAIKQFTLAQGGLPHYLIVVSTVIIISNSFRLTTHQIPIVHEENALTSLTHPYYTPMQRWPSQPRISLYIHDCLTHRGPPHSLTATHPTCSSILSLL